MRGGVNADLLVLARESRGRTQAELASDTGISQSMLSKYENALNEPSDDHLARLVAALGHPRSFFFRTDTPLRAGVCLYHRKQSSMPQRELRRLQARVNMGRLHVAKLLDGTSLKPALTFPRFDIADYDFNIPRIAEMVRLAWRLPSGPLRHLLQVIERAGGLVVRMDFETRKLSAICHPETPPMFFVNSTFPADRIRFTLAHEIGHLVMHHVPTPDQEREADRFAAEFLMPERDIAADLAHISLPRAAELKPLWRVSMAAIIRRAKDLRTISDWQYQRMMADISRRGWRLTEPVEIEAETPTLLPGMLGAHLKDLGYSVSEMAELMGLEEPELRHAFLHEAPRPRLLR